MAGHGLGANAAIAFAGVSGDADGVVALGGDSSTNLQGPGTLPELAPRIRQHIPLLWIVGGADPLRARGEGYAFAKAPPHPSSRYLQVKADTLAAPDAAAGAVLE